MSLLTADRTLALEWVPDATKLTVAQRAAPFHQLLHGWLTEQDVHLVHGGAVGTLGGAALLAGPGGAGKSTTALACLLAGLDYLGDDYVLLSDQPAPTVHSLYSSGKLDPGHARALPGLRSLVDNTTKVPGEKAVWFLYHHFPDQVRAALPLKVVLAPQIVDGSASRAVEISPAAGLRALAPSSILLHPGPGQTALRALSRVLRAVPSFRLELGRDLTAIPDVVANLLAQL